MTSTMLIPDLIATLTAQRDAAQAALAAKAGEHQTMTHCFQTVSEHLKQASGALQALAARHQDVLAELREAKAALLAAEQKRANEPANPFRQCTQAPTLMDNLDPDQHQIMASFTADDPFSTTTGHVMPARALRHHKQAIGLLR